MATRKSKSRPKKTVNVVQVKFRNYAQSYSYITFLDLEIGDHVIVNTPRTGLTVAEVVGHDPTYFQESPSSCKWIVQKIELEPFEELHEIDLRTLKASEGPLYAQR